MQRTLREAKAIGNKGGATNRKLNDNLHGYSVPNIE